MPQPVPSTAHLRRALAALSASIAWTPTVADERAMRRAAGRVRSDAAALIGHAGALLAWAEERHPMLARQAAKGADGDDGSTLEGAVAGPDGRSAGSVGAAAAESRFQNANESPRTGPSETPSGIAAGPPDALEEMAEFLRKQGPSEE